MSSPNQRWLPDLARTHALVEVACAAALVAQLAMDRCREVEAATANRGRHNTSAPSLSRVLLERTKWSSHMPSWAVGLVDAMERRFDLSEQVGILAGSTSIGQSFNRGLMPRSTTDQAIITGVSATVNYALTTFAHSVAQGVARKVVGGEPRTAGERTAERSLILAADLGAMAIGVAAQRLFEQRTSEPIGRAWVRTSGWRFAVSGLAGAIILSTEAVLDRLDPTEDVRWARRIPIALPVGMGLAALQYHLARRAMVDEGVARDAQDMPVETDTGVAVGRAILTSSAVSAGLFAIATGERMLANGVGYGVRRVAPSAAIVAKPSGHLVSLGLIATGGFLALQEVMKRAEHTGDAVEEAYSSAPTSEFVSGGPNSGVSWNDIGREGRRFTRMSLTPDEIQAVMQEPALAEPIRVFVGLESAPTTNQRADFAMTELERLGAFERSLIVFASPTGTGYLNYVMAEAIEYLTRGDCAIVAMQYSLRPSPLSLNRVNIGIEQNSEFLHALKWRLESIPADKRPRLVIFGESLGAQTSEDVFKDEGVAGFHRTGIARGLFLGTPYSTRWRQRWLAEPERWDPDGEAVEVNSYEDYLALPDEVRSRSRYFLLTHYNDPMPKFWFPLAVQAPSWMGPTDTREPGVPRESHWRPYTSFLITFIDVKNAMHVIPGQFVAEGHDYRKDLAQMVSLAYNLPLDGARMERMELALREREFKWAQKRVLLSQVAEAEAKLRDQLEKWGVPADQVPVIAASPVDQGFDPYKAAGAEV